TAPRSRPGWPPAGRSARTTPGPGRRYRLVPGPAGRSQRPPGPPPWRPPSRRTPDPPRVGRGAGPAGQPVPDGRRPDVVGAGARGGVGGGAGQPVADGRALAACHDGRRCGITPGGVTRGPGGGDVALAGPAGGPAGSAP